MFGDVRRVRSQGLATSECRSGRSSRSGVCELCRSGRQRECWFRFCRSESSVWDALVRRGRRGEFLAWQELICRLWSGVIHSRYRVRELARLEEPFSVIFAHGIGKGRIVVFVVSEARSRGCLRTVVRHVHDCVMGLLSRPAVCGGSPSFAPCMEGLAVFFLSRIFAHSEGRSLWLLFGRRCGRAMVSLLSFDV